MGLAERIPDKAERNARLLECVQVVRRLWDGETVTHRGRVSVVDAKLFTLPRDKPHIFAAALTVETARWAGSWADGLITVAAPTAQLKELINAFHAGGGTGKRVLLQVPLSFDVDTPTARREAHARWRHSVLSPAERAEVRTPWEFDRACEGVTEEEVTGPVRVSADVDWHIEQLRGDVEAGVRGIYLHNVSRNQRYFFEQFSRRVLPEVWRLTKR